jgi:general secretion pathway protein G
MNVRRTAKKGFTLIEILIVVIILGILAAIVIPQFTSASTEARQGNLKSQLQTLRSQIALYKLQHRDVAPDGTSSTTFWDQLTKFSNEAGATNATKSDVYKYGPYYDAPVVNPLTNSSDIGAATGAANTGWAYDGATGKIKAMNSNTVGDLFDETK